MKVIADGFLLISTESTIQVASVWSGLLFQK